MTDGIAAELRSRIAGAEPRWRPAGVVVACFFAAALGPAITIFYTLGLFIAPLQEEFGWTTAEISLCIPALTLMVAISSPYAGVLLDRYGPKRVILPSMSLYGLALFLVAFVESLPAFYALFALTGLLCAGSNGMSFIKVLTAWFDGNRGLMIGFAASGAGFGTLVLSPYVQWLIANWGWRAAYMGLGTVIVLVGVPVIAFLIRDRPGRRPSFSAAIEDAKSRPAIRTPESVREAARTRTFWLIATGFVLVAGAINAMAVYLAPIIQGNGASTNFSVLCVSVFGIAVIVGRIATGILLDRFFAPYVCLTIFAGAALGMTTLALGGSGVFALFAAILIGLSIGTEGDALGFLIGRYFGFALFGRIYAAIFCVYMVSMATFPYLTGVSRDLFGSYSPMVGLLAALTLISACCMTGLGPYLIPAERRR